MRKPSKRKAPTPTAVLDRNEADVFEMIAEGKTMQAIADRFGVSRRSVYNWLKAGDESHQALWKDARILSSHAYADQGLEILDGAQHAESAHEVNAARYRAEYRLKLAALRNREEYGERGPFVQVNVNNGELHLAALTQACAEWRRERELERSEVASFP